MNRQVSRKLGARSARRLDNEAGFSLLEVLVVVGILGALAGMAMMVSPAYSRHARAEAGVSQILDVLRSGREVAISQRRNVEVLFIGLNAIRTRRIDIDANGNQIGTTVLRTVELENRVQFRLEDGVPDTPDLFGRATALDFDLVGPWMFTSEGTFIGGSGDVTNGTVFMSIPNEANSSRAITVLGSTALLRPWRWNGQQWVE
jgi:prepilin-type N-terminal cleavage/methylation domain-containing protein